MSVPLPNADVTTPAANAPEPAIRVETIGRSHISGPWWSHQRTSRILRRGL